jgi:hypothetical protein
MNTEVKKIGVVVVDSGKLMLCDPVFLREWKHTLPTRQFEDVQTSKVYQYGKDFKTFQEVLFEGKSAKQWIEERRLQPVLTDTKHEFSYSALTQAIANEGYWQAIFAEGHQGLALALLAEDGTYSVMAEYQEGNLKKIWIEF